MADIRFASSLSFYTSNNVAQTQGAPVKDDRAGKGFKESRWVISRFFAEGKTINFNASLIALGCAAAAENRTNAPTQRQGARQRSRGSQYSAASAGDALSGVLLGDRCVSAVYGRALSHCASVTANDGTADADAANSDL